MALSQFAVTKAKPQDKPYMLADGDGLHLLVKPSGAKFWRLRYRFNGKASMLGLGTFPAVSLLDARQKRDEAKRQLANRTNPSLSRKIERLTAAVEARNTFGAVADEYVANLEKQDMADQTITKNRWLLTDLVRPLRSRPIAEIKPIEILDVLKRVEASGRRDTAHRLRGTIGAVFRYAVATLRAENDPTFALRRRESSSSTC